MTTCVDRPGWKYEALLDGSVPVSDPTRHGQGETERRFQARGQVDARVGLSELPPGTKRFREALGQVLDSEGKVYPDKQWSPTKWRSVCQDAVEYSFPRAAYYIRGDDDIAADSERRLAYWDPDGQEDLLYHQEMTSRGLVYHGRDTGPSWLRIVAWYIDDHRQVWVRIRFATTLMHLETPGGQASSELDIREGTDFALVRREFEDLTIASPGPSYSLSSVDALYAQWGLTFCDPYRVLHPLPSGTAHINRLITDGNRPAQRKFRRVLNGAIQPRAMYTLMGVTGRFADALNGRPVAVGPPRSLKWSATENLDFLPAPPSGKPLPDPPSPHHSPLGTFSLAGPAVVPKSGHFHVAEGWCLLDELALNLEVTNAPAPTELAAGGRLVSNVVCVQEADALGTFKLAWETPPEGEAPDEYRVYQSLGDDWRLIGSTKKTTIEITNVQRDLNRGPDRRSLPFVQDLSQSRPNHPVTDLTFDARDPGAFTRPRKQRPLLRYPSLVTYAFGRRVYAASEDAPAGLWQSRIGRYTDFGYSLPASATDGLSAELVAHDAEALRHLVWFDHLVALASRKEWLLTEQVGNDGLRRIQALPKTAYGTANALPVLAEDSLLAVSTGSRTLRRYVYSRERLSFVSVNMTELVRELFAGNITIRRVLYLASPDHLVVVVMSNGSLLVKTETDDQWRTGWSRWVLPPGVTVIDAERVREGADESLYAIMRYQTKRWLTKLVLTDDVYLDNYVQPVEGAGRPLTPFPEPSKP